MAQTQLVKYLSANGDGTGNDGLKSDGSGPAGLLRYLAVPSWANFVKVHSIRIYGEDTVVTDADASFLNLAPAAALANGIIVGIFQEATAGAQLVSDTLVLDLAGEGVGAITNNSDFMIAGWDYNEITFTAGDSALYVDRVFADPLVFTTGKYLGVWIRDDLSAFTEAKASIVATVG